MINCDKDNVVNIKIKQKKKGFIPVELEPPAPKWYISFNNINVYLTCRPPNWFRRWCMAKFLGAKITVIKDNIF